MGSNRWESIKELFEEVLERAPSERATLLGQICRDDEDVGAEVKRLIFQYESAGDAAFAATLQLPKAAALPKDR